MLWGLLLAGDPGVAAASSSFTAQATRVSVPAPTAVRNASRNHQSTGGAADKGQQRFSGRRPVPSASSGATRAADPDGDPKWTAADAIRFWTHDRMAAATDPSGRRVEPAGRASAQGGSATKPGAKPGSKPAADTGKHFAGIKSVGVLYTGSGPEAHSCTASVVDSPGHDLILTAGHCKSAHGMFVPRYDSGKSADDQTFGVFPVQEWFRDSHWAADKSVNSDLDFAFARVGPYQGKKVQDVVGANTVTGTPGFTSNVTVIGYPMSKYDRADQAVSCPTGTGALAGFNQMRIDCAGMWGGVSGGPWFFWVDLSGSGTGEIVGNVGGWNGGGPDVPTSDPLYNRITYSPVYGDRFFQLYSDAQRGDHTDHGPYQQPALPYSMGTWDTWRNARLLASGDFRGTGHSDMIAVRSDGRATLYLGDGNGTFVSQQQLLPPNRTWTHAATITAGDFTGSNQSDLMVRWSDGEVTLYGDVGKNGLNTAGTRMIGANKTWTHATQITAGRFTADRAVSDLIVRWSDGELTLYTNMGAGTFGKENTLKEPNSSWKDAVDLTSVDFSGSGRRSLMVRWSNGAIDTYPSITTSGPGGATRLQGPNTAWTGDLAMTAGNFTPDGLTDDLVVHRPDGGITLYSDTNSTELGAEHVLVAPAL
ncbi:FG-GAP-like repeat-containing protein [Streptomyces sp. NPDC008222]|uniref:trypsin-like serine peptidase n=1 Tax=Streptomyces sp. NPDC008222 TaxID=3364820 RepID=UPI0036E9E03B